MLNINLRVVGQIAHFAEHFYKITLTGNITESRDKLNVLINVWL